MQARTALSMHSAPDGTRAPDRAANKSPQPEAVRTCKRASAQGREITGASGKVKVEKLPFTPASQYCNQPKFDKLAKPGNFLLCFLCNQTGNPVLMYKTHTGENMKSGML